MEYESDYKVEYERLKKQKEEAEKVNCQILSQLQKKYFWFIWNMDTFDQISGKFGSNFKALTQ